MPNSTRPVNKRKWRENMRQKMKTLLPRQRTLYFTELQKEQSDQFFELHFSKLFLEIRKFVLDVFGTDDLENAVLICYQDFPDEFLNLVKKIARPGSDAHQWEPLLRKGTLRTALIQGVIMMLLDVNVFSSLLFGAARDHKKLLDIEDTTMVDFDGFGRTSLRAETNNVYLHSRSRCGLPPLFWGEVDRVTTQIMHMLIHVYTNIGEDIVADVTNAFFMHQKMHDIVAYAGWLNVAIRLSHKIVAFEWATPGQVHRDPETCIAEENPKLNGDQQRSRPRVMISVAPKITRYDRETPGFLRGKKTYTVMRPQVACYSGRWLDWEDEDAMVPLELYIHGGKTPLAGRRPPSHSTFLLAGFVVIGIILLCVMWMIGLLKLEINRQSGALDHFITLILPQLAKRIVGNYAITRINVLLRLVI